MCSIFDPALKGLNFFRAVAQMKTLAVTGFFLRTFDSLLLSCYQNLPCKLEEARLQRVW